MKTLRPILTAAALASFGVVTALAQTSSTEAGGAKTPRSQTGGSNSTLGSKVPTTSEGSSLGGVGSSGSKGSGSGANAKGGNAAVNDTLFERLDANHDGVLSREEFAKFKTMTGSTESGTAAYPSHGGGKDAKADTSSGVKPGSVPQ